MMRKLAVLTVAVAGAFTLSSFTTKEAKKTIETRPYVTHWAVTCGDGSYGGSFICSCSQNQANAIAYIMCAK